MAFLDTKGIFPKKLSWQARTVVWEKMYQCPMENKPWIWSISLCISLAQFRLLVTVVDYLFFLLNFHSSAVFNFLEHTTLRRENISLPGISMATNFPEYWSRKSDPLRDIAGPRLCCSPASDSPWGTACSSGDCSSAKTEGIRRVYSQGYCSSCVGNETVLEAGVVV